MSRYTPAEIEANWQAAWAKNETFKAVRDETKPKQSHQQQHHAGYEREQYGYRDIFGRPLRREVPRRCRRHQRYNRDRPDGQRLACPEDRVGGQRQYRGVETDLRR